MRDELFNDLIDSVREAGAVRRGDALAHRRLRYEGPILIEVEEDGETAWRLGEAITDLRDVLVDGEPNARALRTALRQSAEGMAALLGISLGTWRGWEQQRRTPRGPARMLLLLAAHHPEALLDTVRTVRRPPSEAA